jgi:hypothetical protein
MSLDCEGFDFYTAVATGTWAMSNRWNFTIVSVTTSGSSLTNDIVAGRSGGQALRMGLRTGSNLTNPGHYWMRAMDSLNAKVRVGFAYKRQNLAETTTGAPFFEFARLGTYQCGLAVNSSGAIQPLAGSGSLTGTPSANNVILPDTWYYIEIYVGYAAGAMRVLVDGVEVLNQTGLSLSGSGTGTSDQMRLYMNRNVDSGGDTYCYFDDLYWEEGVTTDALLGPRVVETLLPNAETATTDWTPSTGTDNSALVDEATPNGDTDYVYASTVGAKDIYDLTPPANTPAEVNLVKVNVINRKTDTGAVYLAGLVESGAVVGTGATFAAAASSAYGSGAGRFVVDPSTGIAFTGASIYNLRAGPKLVSY